MIKRLEDILINCAIIPSAQKGLLGDTSNITVSGDGSALPTGASSSSHCRETGIFLKSRSISCRLRSMEKSRFFFQPVKFDFQLTDLTVKFVNQFFIGFLGTGLSVAEDFWQLL